MNSNIILKRNDIKLFVISLIFFLGLFRMYFLTLQQFKIISCFVMIIYLILYGRNFKVISLTKYTAFFTIIVFASIVYIKKDVNSIFNAFLYSLQLFNIFSVTCCLVRKYSFIDVVRSYTFVSIFFILLIDISVLFNIEFDPLHYQNLSTYLFGNKFVVSYFHIQTLGLLALYYNLNNKSLNISYIFFVVYSAFICFYVDCSTGIIGIFTLFLILLIKNNNIRRFLTNPVTIFALFFISNFIFLEKDMIIRNPIIQYIVVDVLKENLTFTGRFYIYDLLSEIIKEKIFLGYGYNTDIITSLIGYGNAQNGILQIFLECGIVGVITFLMNWYKCIDIKDINKMLLWPLYAVIYAFMICSLVEVCLKLNFMILLALMLSSYFMEEKIDNN